MKHTTPVLGLRDDSRGFFDVRGFTFNNGLLRRDHRLHIAAPVGHDEDFLLSLLLLQPSLLTCSLPFNWFLAAKWHQLNPDANALLVQFFRILDLLG